MKSSFNISQSWVLPLSIAFLLIPILIIEFQTLNYTKGNFVYPLDDTFIQMAIAKNIALHHVWGITAYSFSSSSSSLLYPLLLASFFLITGPNTLIPFIINLISGIILLVVMKNWLQKNEMNPIQQLLLLLCVVLLVPLPVIIIIGMEHTLQILFCFLFITTFTTWISEMSNTGQSDWRIPTNLYLFGIIATSLRYEGMFLIGVACLILVYHGKWRLSLTLGLISMLPILFFGIYSTYKGSYFFPNSVLLKAVSDPNNSSTFKLIFDGIFTRFYYASPSSSIQVLERLLLLLPTVYLLFSKSIEQEKKYSYLLIFLTMAILFHLSLSKSTWLFRYESYLLASSVIAVGLLITKYGRPAFLQQTVSSRYIALLAMVSFFTPIYFRAVQAFSVTGGASGNVYEQELQAGSFLHKYYDSSSIIINDIGAMSFYTSGKKTDLMGLGSIEVARATRNHYLTPTFIDSLSRKEKVSIAAISNIWDERFFPKWKKIAIWHNNNEEVFGNTEIWFYAVDTTQGPELRKHVIDFAPLLPPGVSTILIR